jgi:D-lactate dehydrogenase (cytochrome)
VIIKEAPDEIQNYLHDAANYRGMCEKVFIPESAEELRRLVEDANKYGIKLTVAGNGTGLTGGRVPEGGAVVSMEKLNNIKEFKDATFTAVAEAGVLLNDFQSEASRRNLLYPPDPTETNCFIGATIANNSSGAKTFKYGATRNFVNKLKIVLPTGDTLTLRRGDFLAENYLLKLKTDSGERIVVEIPRYKMPRVKNAAGYFAMRDMDAVDLFVGSEGTLGIIVEAELRLVRKPSRFLSAVIFFDEEENALDFIEEARLRSRKTLPLKDETKIDALALEFFDRRALTFLREDFPSVPQAGAAVWFEQEIESEEDKVIEEWLELIGKYNGDEQNSWLAADEKDRNKFKHFRHALSSKITEFIASQGQMLKVGTDTAVPDDKFKEFYFYSKNLVLNSGLRFVNYGHFGNSHMHLNMLPRNKAELEKAKKLYEDICRKAVRLGGTVSAEHGIGKLKRKYLLIMYGEKGVSEMAKVKKILDPNLILNIGNIFEERFLH